MKKTTVEALVNQWVEDIISGTDTELVDVEFVKEGPGWVLRVFLDKPAGIDIDDCQALSIELSKKLDETDPIPQAYSLEVSSPGIERPLKREADFHRFAGEIITLRTYAPIAGQKNFKGRLRKFEKGIIFLEFEKGLVEIPYDQVAKAKLHVEFSITGGNEE